jgi:sarcosine oxidase
MIGPADGVLVRGAKRSAEEQRLEHQLLTGGELLRRFQVFEPAENMVGLWEPRAGILFPEQAVETHLELAAKAGAELHYNEPMLRWEPDGRGVRVFTAKESFRAKKLLLSTGAWMGSSVPGIKLPLQVERQVMFWFEPRRQPDRFAPEHCPIHIWEYEPVRFFYGFPDLGDGVKTAVHHQGEATAPETVRREADEHDIGAMRSLLRRFMPAADGNLKSSAVCLYTNTPDEHFILDWHPEFPQVLIASPCSGHGFKFSSVIGELAAMLLDDQRPPFDLGLFKIGRFVV